ncbi:MAG TPA: TIGR03663 family protein, partial [Sedimentisphaerales bacterium]|nr:TIGR03663 family protein [Sedimentisphaerales bacterium]
MSGLNESSRGRLAQYWCLIFVVALGAFSLRAPRLCMRPMHTDEAVHADKYRLLLETGLYEYDPHEYHGPTLNYATRIAARLQGARTYAEVTESTLRIVPVVFGTFLVLLIAGLRQGLGFATVISAILVALSPAMVYYSRYYIQEMLLACFTLGLLVCGYRYSRTRSLPWIFAAGAFAGLMHATKETAIIAFGAMGLALGVTILLQWDERRRAPAGVNWLHILLGIGAAVVVSAMMYSVFLRRPEGILDSYRTYGIYFSRAGGENTAHVHPWHYYLQMLLYARYFRGPIWTEVWIVVLALVGLIAAIRGLRVGLVDPKLVRFLAVYTIAMIVVYSAIPYKTPWCVLSFLTGLILLAGIGAVSLWTWAKLPVLRGIVAVLILAGAGHLAFLAWRASFVYYADSRNPYVYAHPTDEILVAVDTVRDYATTMGVGYSFERRLQIAVPGNDYWPLPWYFRDLPYVGYTSEVPHDIGPMIL